MSLVLKTNTAEVVSSTEPLAKGKVPRTTTKTELCMLTREFTMVDDSIRKYLQATSHTPEFSWREKNLGMRCMGVMDEVVRGLCETLND